MFLELIISIMIHLHTQIIKKIITDVDFDSMLQQKQLVLQKNKMHLFMSLFYFILFSTLTYFDLKNEYDYVYEYFQ